MLLWPKSHGTRRGLETEVLNSWDQLARTASLMRFLRTQPPEDPSLSWFGRVRMALPDEDWPDNGTQLMWPLLQVNCRELPYKPTGLDGVEFLALFVSPGILPSEGAPNGDRWLLRTYTSMTDLVEIAEPELQPYVDPNNRWYPIDPPRARAVEWTLIEKDYPAHDTLMNLPNSGEISAMVDTDDHRTPSEGTKIGGWPFAVQSNPWEFQDVEHIIQIDSHHDAGWGWADNGMGYIGRRNDASDGWIFTWQTL